MTILDAPLRRAPAIDRVPVEPYISENHYRLEQERIFGKSWLNIGSVHQIPNPGDYFVRDLAVLGMSILVVRGRDKKIRAFHNVCTHRGNQISHKPCGNARAFTCMVHGWTFDLQGNLAFVPGELGLDTLDKKQHGLVALPSGTWLGFIFIHPLAEPTESLEEFLGEPVRLLENHPIANWDRISRYSMDANCNWKTFRVSFMETSHVQTIHARTIEDYAAEWVEPVQNVMGRHTELTFYANPHHEPHPVEALTIAASPGFMMKSDRLRHPGLNRENKDNWFFDSFGIFPNFIIFFGDGWATSHTFWPDGVNKTYWEAAYYAEPSDNPTQAMANHYFGLKLRDTVREDLEAVEAMQRGMRSGALKELVLCDQERLIGHAHAVETAYIEEYA